MCWALLVPLLLGAAPELPPLEVQIGQLLVVGFRGLTPAESAPILEDVRRRHLGGVILFRRDVPLQSERRNLESVAQLRDLIAALQAAASAPLLVAIDQEGGRVRRLEGAFGLPRPPSAGRLGTLDDPAVTRAEAEKTARVLAALGINLNLAPVVDLAIDPQGPAIGAVQRSYGRDVERVLRHAREVIRAHRAAGLLTALKHFPGHGSAGRDTHLGFADITGTWSRVELEPFRRLAREGLADAVVTAHVFNRTLDPAAPATLSAATIGTLLRGELGFDGVVISDDLQMGAIAGHYDLTRTVELALTAGVDLLVFANNSVYDQQITARVIDTTLRLVEAGRLDRGLIARAYQRVARLKARLPRR